MKTELHTQVFRRTGLAGRVAPFALPILLGFVVSYHAPHADRASWALPVAGLLALATATGVWLLPWSRLPRGVEVIPPLGCILLVALLHEGAGGPFTLFAPLLLLPLFWISLYGTRRDLILGLLLATATGVVFDVRHSADPDTIRFQLMLLAVGVIVCVAAQNQVLRVSALAEQLEAMAHTDGLTGVPNRRAWDEELGRALARAGRQRIQVCVVLTDFDRFKLFNDTRGHQAGDTLLRETTAAWRRMLRTGDFLARYGGEEFAVILPDCPLAEAAAVAERMREEMSHGQSCSAGVACWDGQESADELVSRADDALYAAKRAGRNCTMVSLGSSANAQFRSVDSLVGVEGAT